jgi:hypothetical protein
MRIDVFMRLFAISGPRMSWMLHARIMHVNGRCQVVG